MKGKVYLITNTVNGKAYVGLTRRNLSVRFSGHVTDARLGKGSDKSLRAAIRQFGGENFSITLLDTANDLKSLAVLEILYIEKYDTVFPNGYNLNRGGSASDGRRLVVLEGSEYWSFAEIADAYSILPITLQKRMQSGRWSIEQAAGIVPPPSRERAGIKFVVGGIEYSSISAAAKAHNVDKRTIATRIKQLGWTPDQAFELVDRPKFIVGLNEFGSVTAASAYYGLSAKAVDSRLRLGWSIDETFGLLERSETKKRGRKKGSTIGHLVSIEGVVYQSTSQAAKALNIKLGTFSYRLRKGWTPDQASGKTPAPQNNKRVKVLSVNGVDYNGIPALTRAYAVAPSTLLFRMKRGWTIEQAVGLEPRPTRATVSFIVTDPHGTELVVRDFASFAVKNGFPRKGAALLSVAYKDKSHHWNGWSCRKATEHEMKSVTGKKIEYDREKT